MKKFQPSLNPSHGRRFREEDMWWVDDAWDDATLQMAIEATLGAGAEGRLAIEPFLNSLDMCNEVNLPGLVPSGDWIFRYVFAAISAGVHDGSSSAKGREVAESFKASDDNTDLSDAVRLWLHLSDRRYGSPESWDCLLQYSNLTEADIRFLTEECVNWALYGLGDILAQNHEFAGTERFRELVAESLLSDEDEGSGALVLSLYRVAFNPAVPHSCLKIITEAWAEEQELLTILNNSQDNGTAQKTWKAAALRYWEERAEMMNWLEVEGDSRIQVVARHVQNCGLILGYIVTHPQWDGSPLVTQSSPLAGVAYPTYSGVEAETPHHVARLYLEGAPFDTIRGIASSIASGDVGGLFGKVMFGPGAAAVGAVMRERRDMLGLDGRIVPDEWVNAIFQ